MTYAGSHLDGKSGAAEPSMFQSVSVKLRISLSCLRFFFQPEKNQDEFLFGRDERRTVFRPPASAPKEMMGTGF